MLVTLTSGKHTVTFTVEDDQDLAAQIMDTIKTTYALPSEESSPAMTYVDDEGDVINLNIGVAVEVAEARRIQGDVLDLTLLEPLPVLRRPKLIPDSTEEEPEEVLFDAEAQNPVVQEEQDDELEELEAIDETKATPAPSPTVPKVSTTNIVSNALSHIHAIMADVEAGFELREQQLTQKLDALSLKASRVDQLEAESAKLKHAAQSLNEKFTQARASWQEQNRQDAIALRDAMLHKNSIIAALEATVKQHADRFSATSDAHVKEVQEIRVAHDAEKKVLVNSVAEKQEQISTQQLRISDLEAENLALREKIKAVFSMMQGCMDIATDGPAAKAGAAIDQAFKKVGTVGETIEAAFVAAKEEVTEAVQSTHNYSKAEQAAPKAKAAPQKEKVDRSHSKAAAGGGSIRNVPQKRSAFISQFDESHYARPKDRNAFDTVRSMGFGDVTLVQVAKAMRQNNDDVARVIEQFLV